MTPNGSHPYDATLERLYPAAPAPLAGLPEAPASVNCYIDLAGRKVQLTLRDTDEHRLLARLAAVLAQYPAEPDGASSTPTPEGWCPRHQLQMQHQAKDGRTWYSHRTADGQWCKGK